MDKEQIAVSHNLKQLLSQFSKEEQIKIQLKLLKSIDNFKTASKSNKTSEVTSMFHKLSDRALQKTIAESKNDNIKCSKGCSFCCYINVDITEDEGTLIEEYCKRNNITIDYEQLGKQVNSEPSTYLNLPYKDRRCSFLSKEGTCSIYEARPIACRNYLVVSNPKDCNTEFEVKETLNFVTINTEILYSALSNVSEFNSMSKILLKLKSKQDA